MTQGRHSKRDRTRQSQQNARHSKKRAAAKTPVPRTPDSDMPTGKSDELIPQAAPRGAVRAAPPPAAEPMPPMTLTLTGMAPGGEALGRHDGMVVFVAGGLPGETVVAQMSELRSTWGRARLLEVLEPAPTRIAPRCRHFGLCGGCDWQHIAYDAQLAFKTGIVREQLIRFAHLPDVEVRPCLPSPSDYGYRNTTRLAATEQGRAGYRVAGTNSVFVVEECPILEPALQVELKEVLALELEPGDEVALRVPADPLRVGAFDYHVSLESFFQVNTAMAARLVDEVMAVLAPKPGDAVLDLYAGAGLFTLPLAAAVGKAGRVFAVEAAQAAVADGQRNTAPWPHVGWFQGNVETAIAQASVTDTRWDHVLLDPPRRGVEKSALLAIAALRAPSLVYVSCDPATLARDTVILGSQGYRLLMAQPLDLFPQTAHVETVAQFVRADDDQPA